MSLRLVRIAPSDLFAEWVLPRDGILNIGRSHGTGEAPDVDLWPDRSVSRQQARIRCRDGTYWLEQDADRSGTWVDGLRLEQGQCIRLAPGARIEFGRSQLLFLVEPAHLVRHGPCFVEIALAPALSYVVARRHPRLVTRIAVHNGSNSASAAGTLEIAFGSYARLAIAVPRLRRRSGCVLSPPEAESDLSVLEGVSERTWLPCGLRLNGEEINDIGLGLWLLPCNDFSFAPENWSTLAAFVLPNHPLTMKLAVDASATYGGDRTPDVVLRSLYTHLLERWRIGYRQEPPQYEVGAQRVRLPHDVLTDPDGAIGQGTCLDLAVFLAGALEACGAQPLLAVVDLGTVFHALVGTWRRNGPRLDVIPIGKEYLLAEAIWIDPNGCTRDDGQRCEFADAQARAVALLRNRPLAFALDVVAARHDGSIPLPSSGEPHWDKQTAEALGHAAACATAAGRRPSTVALLVGLLRARSGLLRRAFTERIGDPDHAASCVAEDLGPPSGTDGPSHNYLSILADAKAGAKVEGSPTVQERHLIAALLDARSDSLAAAWKALGVDGERVREAVGGIAPGILTARNDSSRPGGICTDPALDRPRLAGHRSHGG
jgi:pSer/pThr/pTyr-binding forkhead associated (FHA) protein